MNILVTGHSGFVGQNLVKKLAEEGNRVFTLHVLFRKTNSPEYVTPIDFDETNLNRFAESLKGNSIDGIIHLATKFLVKHTLQQVAELVDSNLRLGAMLLDAAEEAKVRWFLNTGTYWQYYRNNSYSPVNLYAAIKQGFETIAQYYIETGTIKFVTLILFDTYGPDDNRPKLLNQWHKISKTGESFKMSGGGQLMKINYIDDVVNAFVLLADGLQNKTGKINNGQVFSLDSPRDYTLRQLAEIFESTLSTKLNIEWGTLPYRKREVMKPALSGEPVPGWKPQVSLREGLKRTFVPENTPVKGIID